MAGPRCKAILNGIVQGLIKALETVLISDLLTGEIDKSVRENWLQRLANCDLAVYQGDAGLLPQGGLAQIILEMQKYELVTDEVWYVLRHPDIEFEGFLEIPIVEESEKEAEEEAD